MAEGPTLNDLLRDHRDWWPGGLTAHQYSTLNVIAHCRSGVLGYVESRCDGCSYTQVAPKSCGNRHCPLCMRGKQWEWAQKVCQRLPDIAHFHVVFTLPAPVAEVFRLNYRAMAEELFGAAAETLRLFLRNNWGVEGGFLAVLHTWGSNLRWHPHLHVLVSAGGMDLVHGKWKACQESYLFAVSALSLVFGAIMLRRLEELEEEPEGKGAGMNWPEGWQSLEQRRAQRARLAGGPWVIYCKSTLRNTKAAVRYLARYTQRIALSNERILGSELGEQRLRIGIKEYRKGGKRSEMKLTTRELFVRLAQHIVPRGLRRIRSYGFLRAGRGQRHSYPRMSPPEAGAKAAEACPRCQSKSWTRTVIGARMDFAAVPAPGSRFRTRTPSTCNSYSLSIWRLPPSRCQSSNKRMDTDRLPSTNRMHEVPTMSHSPPKALFQAACRSS